MLVRPIRSTCDLKQLAEQEDRLFALLGQFKQVQRTHKHLMRQRDMEKSVASIYSCISIAQESAASLMKGKETQREKGNDLGLDQD